MTAVNWLANLSVGLLFPLIAESSIGDYSFVPFAVITLVLLILLYVYLPETKGKTPEQVANMLRSHGAATGAYNRS